MDITISDFVEFVSKAGQPKLTHVKNIKNRPDYDPRTDYWKGLREAIGWFHEQGSMDAKVLDNAISKHEAKHIGSLYNAVVSKYKRFLRKKEIEWREPIRSIWSHDELCVKINPELNIGINGIPHVIKLHLKSTKLTKKNADIMTYVMHRSLAAAAPQEARFCVFDVPDEKFYEYSDGTGNLMPLLKGEASSFIQIWNDLE